MLMLETHKELDEKKKKHQEQLNNEHYEKQHHLNKTKLEIQELKHLVEAWAIDLQTFETIVEDKKITNEEFQEVLRKVDIQKLFEKLEELEKADDTIPKAYRVSKQDYLQAFQNPQTRAEVLQKFDQTLDLIYHQIKGGRSFHGNMFWTYVYLLHQKLIPLQENIIDLKEPLSVVA